MGVCMKFTILTPTYNRAYCLHILYNSLVKQDYKDGFEWLVIDDGSTDNTREMIQSFQQEAKIDIKYHFTPNGGKHRAINVGAKFALGERLFIVDSDDYLLPEALSTAADWFDTIKAGTDFAGVVGLKGYDEKTMIGTTFQGNSLDILYYDRTLHNIYGDKAEIFYTDVLLKHKFPEFEGENFISEACVWTEIANNGLKLRFFNKIIYVANYLDDGLSYKSLELRKKNINGTLYTYKRLFSNKKLPFRLRIRYFLNYLRFYFFKLTKINNPEE